MNRFKKVEKVKRERERKKERKKSENLIEKERERDLQMLEGNERERVSCVIAQTL